VLRLDACWFEQSDCLGYVLDAERVELLACDAFLTWISGVAHYPEAAQHPSFAPGSSLLIDLVAAPDNPIIKIRY
jgi:hypothetical protein